MCIRDSSKLPEIMQFIRSVSDKHGLRIPNVFHAGDGYIHPLILYDEREPDQVKRALQAGSDILGKCIELGGSVTGEHGIGMARLPWWEQATTPESRKLHAAFKRAVDPNGILNPGKFV